MPKFQDLIAAEMFLPAKVFHLEYRAFVKSCLEFIDGLPNSDTLSPAQAVDQLIRAQAAGLIPPMPELIGYSGSGNYAVEATTETGLNIHGGVSFNAITLGVDVLRKTQSVEKITHQVAWEARAIIPDVDRFNAIVSHAQALRESFAREDARARNNT